MKKTLLAFAAFSFALAARAADQVPGHLGLQLWSLRATAMRDGWRAAVDEAARLGFIYVEGVALQPGVTPGEFDAKLASAGLKMVSIHFQYDNLAKDLAGQVALARALGVQYVIVPWIPHPESGFTEDAARVAAANFNRWGAAFRAAGIRFGYHPHGYEFRPQPDGRTAFEVLVDGTDPGLVYLEMDVFWVTHAGQDPVALLRKYPGRWHLMHMKDIRRGAATGVYTGRAPAADDVPVGTGQVDWPALLPAAKAAGVEWYFIEDESVTPASNIPLSIQYLNQFSL